jgi:hypothetical protein
VFARRIALIMLVLFRLPTRRATGERGISERQVSAVPADRRHIAFGKGWGDFDIQVNFTTGVGYQVAVSPNYRTSPTTPSYSKRMGIHLPLQLLISTDG